MAILPEDVPGPVHFAQFELTLTKGSSYPLMLLNEQDAPIRSSARITWTSSEPAAVQVSADGVATAVGEGSAVITAEFEGYTAAVTILVTPAPVTELPAGLYLPKACTHVESRAFAGDSSIETVVLPVRTVSVGAYAFADCANLRLVCILNGDAELDNHAFDGCGAALVIAAPINSSVQARCRELGIAFAPLELDE